MTSAGTVKVQSLPQLGARIPALVLPVVTGALVLGLSLVSYGVGTGIGVGIALALLSPWVPRRLGPWGALAVIGAGQFTRGPSLSWQFLVLLAGLHLLHVLASLTAGTPWRSWIQLRVFVRPLLRFMAIQVPTQLLSVIALLVLAPTHHRGHRLISWAGFGLIGALALAGLALVLAVPLIIEKSRR